MTKFIKVKGSGKLGNGEHWFAVNHIVRFFEWKGDKEWYVALKMTDGETYRVVARANEIIHQIRTAV